MMKVLNLYSGIGGNRKLWENVDVTAVEFNPEIAAIYKDHFPNDNVIIGDAHEFLINNYKDYDFIWASPPCPTHSRARFWGSHREDTKEIYPDMRLYQEIIFLKHYAKKMWCVENVVPYYEPLINAKQLERHLFWTNFSIPLKDFGNKNFPKDSITEMQQILGFDLTRYKIKDKQKLLRNCVNPKLGLHIFNCAIGNNVKDVHFFGEMI